VLVEQSHPAVTHDRCKVVPVLHVDRGAIDGVGGLSMAFIADTPPVMSEGGWGLLFDEAATPDQLDRMRRFMGGEFGEGQGSRISLLGIEYSGAGTAGVSAPFAWAA
jgi:hypothetical protein